MRSPVKPRALSAGSEVRIVAPASPMEPGRLRDGIAELARLGFHATSGPGLEARCGYFAGSVEERRRELVSALNDPGVSAVIAARGGYGSNYLLDCLAGHSFPEPKILLGFSDLTSLQIYFWQKLGWVTFYGPMAAAGFDKAANAAGGYERESLLRAMTETQHGWTVPLAGEALVAGVAEGILLGGCLTLLEATLGTPWALDTQAAILLLEDRAMKPYQVDRSLMHLKQAGKLAGLRGIVLGDFPECEPPSEGSPDVRDVIQRVLAPLAVPIVWRAPIGHTLRPKLTLPLGVRARLRAAASCEVEILEPACLPSRGAAA